MTCLYKYGVLLVKYFIMVHKKIIYFNILLFICLFASDVVSAQVTIAPTNLFIDEQSRFGTYMLINGSNDPQEINVEFIFGYSITDENGNRSTVYDDPEMAEKYSVSEWLRAFPQNFILQPGQRQVVRMLIRAPQDLEDGTYWARIKTSAVPQTPPVELQSNEAVTAQVNFKIEQITGLFFKKGNVTTGIEVEQIRTNIEDDFLTVLTDFRRTGNSPFLGSVYAELLDSRNQVVSNTFLSTTLYFDGTVRSDIDLSSVDPGEYTLRVRFVSERTDVSPQDLVQMEPVTATKNVTIR